jgi:hypothetical protein
MSDSRKKFELPSLQSVMGSVKGIINPEGGLPDPDPSDELGMQLQQLALLTKTLEEYQEEFSREMSDRLNEVAGLASSIYSNVEALRGNEKG